MHSLLMVYLFRKKVHVRKFVLLIYFVLLLSFPAYSQFSGSGSGTELDPYIISNPTQLDEIRNNLTAYYELANDIDLTTATSDVSGTFYNAGAGWDPIDGFEGELDGGGFRIDGLFINRPEGAIGLFGDIWGSVTIINLHLSNVNVTGLSYVGALLGRTTATTSSYFSQIGVNGTVTASGSVVGGIIGTLSNGDIEKSYMSGTVSGTGGSSNDIGGIAGRLISTGDLDIGIRDCYAIADISGNENIGGFVGYASSSKINFSYFSGSVNRVLYGVGIPTIGGTSGNVGQTGVYYSGEAVCLDTGLGIPLGTRSSAMTQEKYLVGWDFTNVWAIDEGISYPYLQWEGSPSTKNNPPDMTPVVDLVDLPDLSNDCEINVTTPPTATSYCGNQIDGVSDMEFPITTLGETIVTWTYRDQFASTTTQTQSITITDAEIPVADLGNLPDVIAECSVDLSSSLPTAIDNCLGTIDGVSDTEFPITTIGITEITWSYEDANGNISTQTQNVIITDGTAPEPDLDTLQVIYAECDITDLSAPTATDNCTGEVTGTSDVVFPIILQDTTIITWNYTDSEGNSSTQQQAIILNDVTAPVRTFTNLEDIVSVCDGIILEEQIIVPTATDNCDGIIDGVTDVIFPLTESTTITWTFADERGNIELQTQKVIIGDVTAPVPDLESLADLNSECSIELLTVPTATDNCDGLIEGVTNAIFPLTETTTISWVFEDKSGNSIIQTQDIIIDLLDNSVTQNGSSLIAIESGVQYQWIDCNDGTRLLGATAQTFSPQISGTYMVEISSGDCVITSECFEVTILGLSDDKNELGISLYPNPVGEALRIDKGINQQLKIKILDIAGREIYVFTSLDQVTLIDFTQFNPGTYLVSMTNNKTQVINKVVKK
ncbi:MAG: T9SS type A sorting domain-containing protein [Bacteroidota bacterium]